MRDFRKGNSRIALTIFKSMISKPEKIVKRITKAVGKKQAVLILEEWQEELMKSIEENENSFTQTINKNLSELQDNSFTRIIADYSFLSSQSSILNPQSFFNEARRLLLPTGFIIITANCQDGIFDKLMQFCKKDKNKKEENVKKIKPKELQDQIHDNGFLIDGYYGYPSGDLIMIAQIQKKEVSTLFNSNEQITIIK